MKSKNEVLDLLRDKTGFSKKDCSTVYDALIELIKEELMECGEFSLTHLGRLEVTKRSGRLGIHPNTQEQVVIPPHKSVKLKITQGFKEQLNQD